MENPGAIDNVASHARIQGAAATLRSTKTIRKRAQALLERARRGESIWFTVNDGAMDNAAALVAQLTKARYPDLKIPYHSRWRHFETGGVDRAAQLNAALASASRADRAIAQIDLALVSVLLDAGAGADWQYEEKHHSGTHQSSHLSRSEGLGVASFHAFMEGLFSSDLLAHYVLMQRACRPSRLTSWARRFRSRQPTLLSGLKGAPPCCVGWAKHCKISLRFLASMASKVGQASCSRC